MNLKKTFFYFILAVPSIILLYIIINILFVDKYNSDIKRSYAINPYQCSNPNVKLAFDISGVTDRYSRKNSKWAGIIQSNSKVVLEQNNINIKSNELVDNILVWCYSIKPNVVYFHNKTICIKGKKTEGMFWFFLIPEIEYENSSYLLCYEE